MIDDTIADRVIEKLAADADSPPIFLKSGDGSWRVYYSGFDLTRFAKLIIAECNHNTKAEIEVERHISVLTDALHSIVKNTCCKNCREAALVARAALASYVGIARSGPVTSHDQTEAK